MKDLGAACAAFGIAFAVHAFLGWWGLAGVALLLWWLYRQGP
jgi:hypothetical protein